MEWVRSDPLQVEFMGLLNLRSIACEKSIVIVVENCVWHCVCNWLEKSLVPMMDLSLNLFVEIGYEWF